MCYLACAFHLASSLCCDSEAQKSKRAKEAGRARRTCSQASVALQLYQESALLVGLSRCSLFSRGARERRQHPSLRNDMHCIYKSADAFFSPPQQSAPQARPSRQSKGTTAKTEARGLRAERLAMPAFHPFHHCLR